MGKIQSELNQALHSAAVFTAGKKLVKGQEQQTKELGEIEKRINELEPWQQQIEDERAAIHKDQMSRINRSKKAGKKVYIPEDLSQDPEAMGPRPYTPALFGADGFELHDPSLAQSMRAYKINRSGQIVEKNTTAQINGKVNQKERLQRRIEVAKDGTYLTVSNIQQAAGGKE